MGGVNYWNGILFLSISTINTVSAIPLFLLARAVRMFVPMWVGKSLLLLEHCTIGAGRKSISKPCA